VAAAIVLVGPGDTQPAILGVRFERVKCHVEILAAPLATENLVSGCAAHTPTTRFVFSAAR